MKFLLFFVGVVAFVCAQESETPVTTLASLVDAEEEAPRVYIRDLPADVLRDFGEVCFASTRCEVFQVGQQWYLTPFCGVSTCMRAPNGALIERVQDCGPLPKPDPKCKIINEEARNETFPICCPKFQCEGGVKLEFPTPEELALGARVAIEPEENETPAN